MLHYNNKPHTNSLSLKQTSLHTTTKDFRTKKHNPFLKESSKQISQSITSLYPKQKHTTSHIKSVSHSLTNSMSSIPVAKQTNQNLPTHCTSHSLSKDKNVNKASGRTIAFKGHSYQDKSSKNTQGNSIEKQDCSPKETIICGFRSIFDKEKEIMKKRISAHVSGNVSKEVPIDGTLPNESLDCMQDNDKEKRRLKHYEYKKNYNLLSQHNEQQPLKLYIEGYKNQVKTNLSIQVNKDYDYYGLRSSCNTNPKYVIHSSSSQSPIGKDEHKVNFNSSTTSSNTKAKTKHNDLVIMPTLLALQGLEEKYMQKLNDNNVMNSKSKRYNTIKLFFEELTQLFPSDYQNTFGKIMGGYHEVVLAFSIENKTLKEANNIYQKRLGNIEKNHKDVIELLKRKENELGHLKQRLAVFRMNDHHHVFKDQQQLNQQFNKIDMKPQEIRECSGIKEQNDNQSQSVEDLDSLYFFDKVENKGKEITHTVIPTLPIQLEVNRYGHQYQYQHQQHHNYNPHDYKENKKHQEKDYIKYLNQGNDDHQD